MCGGQGPLRRSQRQQGRGGRVRTVCAGSPASARVAVGSPTARLRRPAFALAVPRTDYAVAVVDNCFLALWLTMWKTLDECEL